MKILLGALALVAVGIIAVGFLYEPPQPAPMSTVRQPEPVVHMIPVRVGDGMQSVMGQAMFRQPPRTTGVSPDTIRFTFDGPVDILGVLVSVDVHDLPLVEFAVGVNPPVAYGTEGGPWLIHTSSTGESTDEHIWFPVPFEVGPDDFVSVGAWLYNGDELERSVSPEVIVYFTSRPEA